MAIAAEWEVGWIAAELFDDEGKSRQRPIKDRRKSGRHAAPGLERHSADGFAKGVAGPPDRPEPGGPVLEIVIDVEQEGRARLQLANAIGKRPAGIRNVVEDAQRITEVLAVVGKRDVCCRSDMEVDVAPPRKPAPGDFQSLVGGIDAVKEADARSYARGPAPRAAAEVEPFRLGKLVERKQAEISGEGPLIFVADKT